jgi:methyl-accepting chemotaxis protein
LEYLAIHLFIKKLLQVSIDLPKIQFQVLEPFLRQQHLSKQYPRSRFMIKSWFYGLGLATKMFISFSFAMFFGTLLGAVSLYQAWRMGDLLMEISNKYHVNPEVISDWMRLFETLRYLTIGIMIFSLIFCSWLMHFTVKTVACKSLWYALQALEKIADGDLRQNINVKSNEEIGKLFSAMKRIIDKLREFAGDVNNMTHTLAESSQVMLTTIEELNASAHDQTTQTEQVASAIIEMSQTLGDVAGTADQASKTSQETSEAAQRGFETVEMVMMEMRKIVESVESSSVTIGKLGQSSRQIGDIIETINDVAEQTNLLALNAAIEAARAGEHGRGFAVVADEVRALAERTAKATKEIGSMITMIQQDTALSVSSMMTSKKEVDGGLQKAEEARNALEHIVDISRRSLDMIASIAAATEEQSAVTAEISKSIDSIARGTRTTETASDQVQELAREFAKLSSNLEQTATWFKIS